MKQLALLQGQEVVKHIPLSKDSYSIGRSKDNDLVLEHPKVSRNHARIFRENGHYVLQDLNSTNYVFVNGVRVKQKQLQANDRIQISSDIHMLFLEQGEEPTTQDKGRTLLDIQKHFVHRDDLLRLKKVTQSVVLLNSLDTILMQILKEGISLTGAERGLIVLTDGKGQIQWKYATTYRIDRDKAEAGEADISQSILQDALSQRNTVVRFGENQAAAASESMMALKIYSAMCAPLLLHERIIGLFYVDARQLMNNFTEVDQFLFDYLADHAAIAIFNAKRYADQHAEVQRLRLELAELQANHEQLDEKHQQLLKSTGKGGRLPGKDAPLTHTYAAGGIVVNASGEVLLMQITSGEWTLPRGTFETGDEQAVTAQRRIYEASGISYLHLIQALGSYHRSAADAQGLGREMQTIYMYFFTTEQSDLTPAPGTSVRWFEPDEVPQMLIHPKDKDFFLQPDVQDLLSQQATHRPGRQHFLPPAF